MTKNEIINDIKFRQRCGAYGLDWSKFNIFNFPNKNYIISVAEPIGNIYVLFDQNYNTICIEKCDWINDFEDLKNFVEGRYNIYSNLPNVYAFKKNFGYPFENFSLKQIIDLANRVEIMETNNGHTLSIKVNGEWYDRNSNENQEYFQLLSYVKFLGEQIKSYFIINYHMQAIGFKVPDLYEYVRTLISKLNECVDFYLEHNRRPYPSDILSGLGQNYREKKYDGILYDVVYLLMKDKGYKIKSDSHDETEMVNPQDNTDLSIVALELLELLKLSDEELKIKEEKINQKLIGKQEKAWHSDFSETLGFEYPDVSEANGSSKSNSFLGCIEDMHLEPYEVPGLLPRESKTETGPILAKRKTPPRNTRR